MVRARTTRALEASLWLAAALLVGGLVWGVSGPRQPLVGWDVPRSLWNRPVAVAVTLTPRIGQDCVAVEATYTLLGNLRQSSLAISPYGSQWRDARAWDADSALPIEPVRLGGDALISVALARAEAGYTFTLAYEYDILETGMFSVGNVEIIVADADQQTALTWRIPTSLVEQRLGALAPLPSVQARTTPRPSDVLYDEQATSVSFRIEGKGYILLSYAPASGLTTRDERTTRRRVQVRDRVYTFVVHYPPGVEDVVHDVLRWVDESFPRLVDELGGVGPPSRRLDILLRPSDPASAWTDGYFLQSYQQISIYLRKLGGRPSSFLAHEIMHGFIRGYTPTYFEEGLVEHFNQRVFANGRLRWSSLALSGIGAQLNPDLLMQDGYGKRMGAIHSGYLQGAQLVNLLYSEGKDRGVDLPRELAVYLRDERHTLSSAIGEMEHGELLYTMLQQHGLATHLPSPAECTRGRWLGPANPCGHRPPFLERLVFISMALAAVALVWVLPMSAPLIAALALIVLVPLIPALGYSSRYLVVRFAPAMAAGLIAGALLPRAIVALRYGAQKFTPGEGTFRKGMLLHGLVVAWPILGLAVPLWGPALFPFQLDIPGQVAVVLFSQCCLFSAPFALLELRLNDYLP